MSASVRLPAVMAGYACARTMACCTSERVYLAPREVRAIGRRLRAEGATQMEARVRGAVVTLAPDLAQLRHNATGCVLLDVGERRCDLHAHAGIGALPAVCRSFPRIVTRTPTGVESAFVLDCPTAAGLVASAPAAFTWVSRPLSEWPYEASRAIGATLEWDHAETIVFEDLAALRQTWWLRMAESKSWVAVAAAMRRDPGMPAADERAFHWPIVGQAEQAQKAAARLATVTGRGGQYAQLAEPLAETLMTLTPTVLAACALRHADVFACVLGLSLQLAGVHEAGTAHDGIREAAWQALISVVMMAALVGMPGVEAKHALADAVNVAAQMRKEATFATRE